MKSKQKPSPVLRTKIVWHGTSFANGMKIIKKGFAPLTYMATHSEDAILMGGPMLFMVSCNLNFEAGCWQFRIKRRWEPNRILKIFRISLSRYSPKNKGPYFRRWDRRNKGAKQ